MKVLFEMNQSFLLIVILMAVVVGCSNQPVAEIESDEPKSVAAPSQVTPADFKITRKAELVLRKFLDSQGNKYVRVGCEPGGCFGLKFEVRAVSEFDPLVDRLVPFELVQVVMDESSRERLAGYELDYIDSIESPGFEFRNPDFKSDRSTEQPGK